MATRDSAGSGSGSGSGSCVVYSFGSFGDTQFEQRVRDVVPGCEIHTFDPTCMRPAPLKREKDLHFHSLGLGGGANHSTPERRRRAQHQRQLRLSKPRSKFFEMKLADVAKQWPVLDLGTIMRRLGHRSVDILKIDVEGSEFG